MVRRKYINSPKSGRDILVDGDAYNKLLKSTTYRQKTLRAKVFTKETSKSSSKSRGEISTKSRPSHSSSGGCTNANRNKYPDVKASDFCGSSGGSCARAYPVNTPGRARAALSYARYAPNPEGIKSCVRRKAAEKGWLKNDKIKM